MSKDLVREQFEAWARSKGHDLEYRNIPGVGQFYECHRTLLAFEVWQASREAVVVDLPGLQCLRVNQYDYQEAREQCRRAIEAEGLKVSQ